MNDVREPCLSVLLFSPSSSQDNKADVILKYNADEARSLKAYGELPEHGEWPPHVHSTVCLSSVP